MALLFYNIWFFHKKVEESKLSRGGCHFYCVRPFLSNAPYIIDDKMNPYQLVAVGMPVARHPPHRSRRALLTHRAPASGVDAKTLS